MGKLIDADKLKRKCQKTATEAWKMKIKASAETIMNQFIDFIDETDAVDAIPVVRCKDCKHHHYQNGIPYCDRYYWGWKDDDFCSRGERKDGDNGQI